MHQRHQIFRIIGGYDHQNVGFVLGPTHDPLAPMAGVSGLGRIAQIGGARGQALSETLIAEGRCIGLVH